MLTKTMNENPSLKYILLCKEARESKGAPGAFDFMGVLDSFYISTNKLTRITMKVVAVFELHQFSVLYELDLTVTAPNGRTAHLGKIQAGKINNQYVGTVAPTVSFTVMEGVYRINLLYQNQILGYTTFEVLPGEVLNGGF